MTVSWHKTMNHIFILTQKGCNTVLENTALQPLRDSLSYKKSLILSRLPRLRNLVSALPSIWRIRSRVTLKC